MAPEYEVQFNRFFFFCQIEHNGSDYGGKTLQQWAKKANMEGFVFPSCTVAVLACTYGLHCCRNKQSKEVKYTSFKINLQTKDSQEAADIKLFSQISLSLSEIIRNPWRNQITDSAANSSI